MADILLIEDEKSLRVSLARMLERAEHIVVQAGSVAEATSAFRDLSPDLVITDVNLGDGTGLEFARQIRSEGYDGVVVAITAFGTIENAVAAMKEGADDFLQKPLKLEELPLKVEKWLDQRKVLRRLALYERMERTREAASPVLGQSAVWVNTLRLTDRLASIPLQEPSETEGVTLPTILLLGETGAGKGMLARYIHAKAIETAADANHVAHTAARKDTAGAGQPNAAPFVHVNCSALPPTLVEAELFGHERGAFTDARQARTGLFEMADGGTIFLDEISETPLELQAKLLLVVEQGKYRRVGGSKDRTVRVRVVAASNADLVQRVEKGSFRRDLYYRLNSFTVRIPPLRERTGDAAIIARAMLDRLTKRYSRPPMRLSSQTIDVINSYPWPGNVRELANTMQRVAMFCDSSIVDPEHLALEQTLSAEGPPLNLAEPRSAEPGLPTFNFAAGTVKADELEKSLIMQALRHTGGNVSRAAILIGITRASMRYRMEQYGLNETHLESKEVAHQ